MQRGYMDFGYRDFAGALRREIAERNRIYARGRVHVESYGSDPVVVYGPDGDRHANFYDPAYTAIQARPEWAKRLAKVHTHGKSLPKPDDPKRKWRELDSCMSSDALLMNVFCTPGVMEAPEVRRMLGMGGEAAPVFGWKARVPLASGLFDRTEVDMRCCDLLVEAKLTEGDFQCRAAQVLDTYRDLDVVFDRELLPRLTVSLARRKQAVEFAEEFTQEWEETSSHVAMDSASALAGAFQAELARKAFWDGPHQVHYQSYQLIRNVLAAYTAGARFCVICDARRPDLREAWFTVMAAVRSAETRTRCLMLTWQELAGVVPAGLREFLEMKYGICAC